MADDQRSNMNLSRKLTARPTFAQHYHDIPDIAKIEASELEIRPQSSLDELFSKQDFTANR